VSLSHKKHQVCTRLTRSQVTPGSVLLRWEAMLTMRSLACTTALLVLVLLPLTQSGPQCLQACALVIDPVCGTDGNTYSNSCFLDIEACENPHLNLRIDHNGPC
ncbi:hypothetical protein OTU49_012698, partial [Cherax quadricarinatus]